jgi:hypothetical protein
LSRSGEEQQEGDQQGEDAQRLGDGEDRRSGGRTGRRRRTDCEAPLQELAEQVADADGGAPVPMAARPAPMNFAEAGSMDVYSLSMRLSR